MSKDSLWCKEHWTPYITKPGGIVVGIKMFQIFASHKKVQEYMTKTLVGINEAMNDLGPLCCFLGNEYMGELLKWVDIKVCGYQLGRNMLCHRPKGHTEEHQHFYPIHPEMVLPPVVH